MILGGPGEACRGDVYCTAGREQEGLRRPTQLHHRRPRSALRGHLR